MSSLTASRAREMLDYDPQTGAFTWKVRPLSHFKSEANQTTWNKKNAGKAAGLRDSIGYVSIRIDRKPYGAHRLAWLLMTGEWPAEKIDHRDLNRSNNAFSNLREATHSDNITNTRVRKDSLSGRKGVHFHKASGLWHVRIMKNGKHHSVGYFRDIESAATAYERAAQKFHGEFARVA